MIKVLIVEDDPMVREINEGFLGKVEGFILLKSVGSIEKAKEEILKNKPDLILLDVFFPQGVGTELLKWIRINDIKSDVILITAQKSMETVEEAFRYGAVDYIIKPFVFKRFKEALVQYKDRKRKFKAIEDAEQEFIDEIALKESNTNSEEEEEYNDNDIRDIKGVSQHTYEKIIECISKNKEEAITAQEVADLMGISRITARRYLDLLEREGKVILEMEYGKIGRPLNKYKLINR
ncbi:response regulator [Clostridium bovifaecis]|uniref:Transcriptional regulatory protein n=1 Tax=Clostridium bovifaecis TaxID=2184719 RepID=A0A6I6ELL2_9CLOT|nr:response regulator [Clostridium bovifaecis]